LIVIPLFFIVWNLSIASSGLPSTKHPVYALNSTSYSISKIDGDNDNIVSTIKLPDITNTFSVAPNGNLIVPIIGRGDSFTPYKQEIHVISPEGKEIGPIIQTKYIPDYMYIKDNRIAVIMHYTLLPGHVVPLTLVNLEQRSEIAILNLNGFAAVVGAEKNDLLVYAVDPSSKAAQILKINLNDRSITEVMTLSEEYLFGRALFHNGKLYGIRGHKGANIRFNQTLQVIDFISKKIEKILPLSDNPYKLAFVDDKIYITHYNNNSKSSASDNRVSIVDANSYEIEKIIEVGKGPADICYSKSLGKVYTANCVDSSVSVIDTKSRKLIKNIPTNQISTNVIRCPE